MVYGKPGHGFTHLALKNRRRNYFDAKVGANYVFAPTLGERVQGYRYDLMAKYEWAGPVWSRSDTFTSILVSARIAVETGNLERADRDIAAAQRLMETASPSAYDYAEGQLREIVLLRQSQSAPNESVQLQLKAEEDRQRAYVESENQRWTPEDEARDQALLEASQDGSLFGELGYGLSVISPDIGSAVVATGEGIETAFDPMALIRSPFARKLLIVGALGAVGYYFLKKS